MNVGSMKISAKTASIVICAGVGALVIAFNLTEPDPAAPVPSQAIPAAAVVEEASTPNPTFEKTADTVTLGTGLVPSQTEPELERIDQMLRHMATLPEGEEKLRLGQEIGRMSEHAAMPVLLNWATTTPDRAVLRASLTALARMGDAEMIDDVQRRYAATRSYDDRYRLAKIIGSMSNPEAVPALMALADSPDAPRQLAVAATDALATVGTGPAVSLLLQKLDEEPPEESQRLQTAIGRINREEALPTLQFAARGNKDAPTVRGRIAAIQALANFPKEETAELFEELSGDATREVSEAARALLERSP